MKTRCESIETTIRDRRLAFAGSLERQSEVRLPRRVMLGKMTGGDGRQPGGQPKSWQRFLLDLKAFDATEGSTEHSKLGFGGKAEVWTFAAEKAGKWYGRGLE